MTALDTLDLTRQDAEALPFRIDELPNGQANVWWDIGHGSLALVAIFVCREFAEDWLLSRIKISPSR